MYLFYISSHSNHEPQQNGHRFNHSSQALYPRIQIITSISFCSLVPIYNIGHFTNPVDINSTTEVKAIRNLVV